jgi:hypothetical protein
MEAVQRAALGSSFGPSFFEALCLSLDICLFNSQFVRPNIRLIQIYMIDRILVQLT